MPRAAAGRAGAADRGDRAPARPGRSTSSSALVRGAYPFAELSREQLEGVLDMLAGRYPSDEFAELRPRVVWDRGAGTVRGRDGARSLAVQNAGTIPDRGPLRAWCCPTAPRVGELDEEMVYEARTGQTFMLGASTWRIEEITRDRVVVTPAPGRARGDAVLEGRGRGAARTSWARRSGGWRASWSAAGPERAAARLRDESAFDRRAATNLVAYLEDQARRDRHRAQRPRDRGRALPRRDRRLAPVRAHARSAPASTRRGRWRSGRGCARETGQEAARHLGRRRHRPAPARRRRGPARPTSP